MAASSTIHACIDSFPLGTSLHDSFDYSGLQVYGATEAALADLTWRRDDIAKTYSFKIPKSLRRSCGTRVSASDFAFGLHKATQTNPFIKNFLLRNLTDIKSNHDDLTLQFKSPNFRFVDAVAIPNLAAKSPVRHVIGASGAYSLRYTTDGNMELNRNPYSLSSMSWEKIKIEHLQDPEGNIEAFENGSVDVTADTAFPFSRIERYRSRPQLDSRFTGLRCFLRFGERLAPSDMKDLRLSIASIVHATSFENSPLKSLKLHRWSPFDPSCRLRLTPTDLTLAYDDFYPNADIANAIAQSLTSAGFKVKVLIDDYYCPKTTPDLRLSIGRSLALSDYLYFSSLLTTAPLRASITDAKRYLSALLKWEATNDRSTIEEIRIHLHTILNEVMPVIPLFEMPSLSLKMFSEPNPLLHFVRKVSE